MCNFLREVQRTITAVIAESVSLTGIDHQTPSNGSAKSNGIHSANGIRYNTCRVKLRKIALPALPMDVNKFPVTIWNPMMSIELQMMRIGLIVWSIRMGSCVNICVTNRGKHSPRMNTIAITPVAYKLVR